MRLFVVLAVALIFTQAALAQSMPRGGATVRRATILVEDIEKSIDFYQRLGLVKGLDRISEETDAGGVIGSTDLPLTAEPRRGRLVLMRGSADATAAAIGLLYYERPPLASARSNLIGLGTGDVIMDIEVGDLGAVYNSLQQIGTKFHKPPQKTTLMDANGSERAGTHMLVYDPDGHMVEVTQR